MFMDLCDHQAPKDFAQVGLITVYMLLYGGNLPPGLISDCMSNQLAFMLTFELFDPGPLFGNNCDIIDTGPPARFGLSLLPTGAKPDDLFSADIRFPRRYSTRRARFRRYPLTTRPLAQAALMVARLRPRRRQMRVHLSAQPRSLALG